MVPNRRKGIDSRIGGGKCGIRKVERSIQLCFLVHKTNEKNDEVKVQSISDQKNRPRPTARTNKKYFVSNITVYASKLSGILGSSQFRTLVIGKRHPTRLLENRTQK